MNPDLIWIILGTVLLIVGIIGCILPVIPGQILSWTSLLVLQFTSFAPFTVNFLVTWALITALVSLIDNLVPLWTTKKMGGSKKGIWGAALGMLIGIFFFPPIGLIIGLFVGAFVGEIVAGKTINVALKSGLGSFLGFLGGTVMKLVISLIMGYHFVANAYNI